MALPPMRQALSRAVKPARLRPYCQSRSIQSDNRFFKVSEEVRQAVEAKQPVVALETTIYTHGFPHPENIRLALYLESIVRSHGAVPATIGFLDGVARVGLGSHELKALLEKPGPKKISRRDIGFACGLGLHGGTTIAGTMVLAHMAGIKVFATGGLGGVHRGGEVSLDISADLTELGRTPVAVICSGCKGFLDIPRTLEYLETEGVGVATFADGREGNVDFPAFWSRDSGIKSPMTIRSNADAASIIDAQTKLEVGSGLLLANPVPEKYSIPVAELQDIIAKAIVSAEAAGASGSDNTPYILQAIKDLTGNRSVLANEALIERNVARGSEVAIELSRIERSSSSGAVYIPKSSLPDKVSVSESTASPDPSLIGTTSQTAIPPPKVDILVAGSLAVDLSCDYIPAPDSADKTLPQLHASNMAHISQGLGGVGHNVAQAAQLTGATARLCTIIADDLAGKSALVQMKDQNLDTSAVKVLKHSIHSRTAQYVAINDSKKDLMVAMADMSIFEKVNAFEGVWAAHLQESQPDWAVVDANWSAGTLKSLISAAKASGAKVAFEPVSATKSVRLLHSGKASEQPIFPNVDVDVVAPNLLELTRLYTASRDSGFFERQDWWEIIDAMGIPASGARSELVKATSSSLVDSGIPQQTIQLLPFLPCILTKLGPQGVLLSMLLAKDDERLSSPEAAPYILSSTQIYGSNVGGVYLRHFNAPEILEANAITSVNGAGDTFLGVLISGLAQRKGSKIEDWVDTAQLAALRTLKSTQTVAPDLEPI